MMKMRKRAVITAMLLVTCTIGGCGLKKNAAEPVSTKAAAQEETKPYSNGEEYSRYLEVRQSVHQSYVEANNAYNASLAAEREEREAAKRASIEASIAEEEASKQAERDDMQRIMEEQSVTPGKASDHETAADTVSDPVTGEDVTVPEGAAAVLPTEEPTKPAQEYPAGTLIETTEQTKADGLWPNNSSTNNLDGKHGDVATWHRLYEIADAWCNNGKGGTIGNEDCRNQMVAAGAPAHAKVTGVTNYQFSGTTTGWWDFQMNVMTEAEDSSHGFSYWRSFYDPATDTTTVWYAYSEH